MRKVIVALFLGIIGDVFGQNKVSVHITEWAGGVCCSSGVNVQISIGDQNLLLSIDSVVVEAGYYHFVLHYSNFQSNNGSNCFSAFSWASSRYEQMEYSASYTGITADAIRYPDHTGERCVFYYRNGTKKEVEVDLTEDMIAYP